MNRPTLRRFLWIGGLVAALVALRAAASGDLATPPLTSLDGLGTWADDRGPAASALGLARVAAELATWYLLLLTALHAVAAGVQVRGMHALADALARPAVSRLVRAGLGVGLVASSAVVEPATRAAAVVAGGTATMRPLDEPAPRGGTAWMTPRPPQAPAEQPRPAPSPTPPGPATHRVEPGESLWTIAEETLAAAWHRAPTDRETDPYWRAVVAANADRLVDDDPDLILPGQVLEVPPPPPPPT